MFVVQFSASVLPHLYTVFLLLLLLLLFISVFKHLNAQAYTKYTRKNNINNNNNNNGHFERLICTSPKHLRILYTYICNGVEWSKDKTQAAESIKWRPQQAYCSNQFLLVQPQTVFSTHPKSSRSRIDKRTARATGNTRYRYSKIAPLDHKMADNCVSLARTNTLSSTITKLIKTSKTSNKSYSYHLLNRINKMYTHDLFYLQQEWEAWLAPVYIQIRTTKSQVTQCTKYNCH